MLYVSEWAKEKSKVFQAGQRRHSAISLCTEVTRCCLVHETEDFRKALVEEYKEEYQRALDEAEKAEKAEKALSHGERRLR